MFVFIETSLFSRLLNRYLDDAAYAQLQSYLLDNPRAGDVIPGSGGVRKLRWRTAARGKRGGVRIIYFVRTRHGEIWLLTLYAKSVTATMPAHVLRRIKEEIDAEG